MTKVRLKKSSGHCQSLNPSTCVLLSCDSEWLMCLNCPAELRVAAPAAAAAPECFGNQAPSEGQTEWPLRARLTPLTSKHVSTSPVACTQTQTHPASVWFSTHIVFLSGHKAADASCNQLINAAAWLHSRPEITVRFMHPRSLQDANDQSLWGRKPEFQLFSSERPNAIKELPRSSRAAPFWV